MMWPDRAQLEEIAREITQVQLRNSPIAAMLRRHEIEMRWGPTPRTVLLECTEQCKLHHCNNCGIRVIFDGDADPRMCTPEPQPGRLCFECNGASSGN